MEGSGRWKEKTLRHNDSDRARVMRGARSRALMAALLAAALLSVGALKKGKAPAPHEAYGAKAELVVRDVTYTTADKGQDKLKLDVYSNPHEGLWPAVVAIHGGAWVQGDKTMDNKVYVCQVLANNGYVVFDINYRLVPQVRVKEQVEDAMAAVIWVKMHAREYGADPERVAVSGGSAGGHLGALVAWASADPYFVPTGFANSPLDSDVKVAALYYPVIDFDRTMRDMGSFLAPLGGLYFTGKTGKAYQEELKHISPVNFIRPGVTPTLFLCGDADSLKLYPQSVESVDKLKALGVDSQLFTAPGKDHGFTWNYWEPESVASAQAVVKFFDKYLKK